MLSEGIGAFDEDATDVSLVSGKVRAAKAATSESEANSQQVMEYTAGKRPDSAADRRISPIKLFTCNYENNLSSGKRYF